MSQKFRMDSEGIPLEPEQKLEQRSLKSVSVPGIPYSEPIPLRTLSAYTLEHVIGQVRRDRVRYWFMLPKITVMVRGAQRIIDDCILLREGSQHMVALTLLPYSAAREIQNLFDISGVHDRIQTQILRASSRDDSAQSFAPIVIYDSSASLICPITSYEIHKPLSVFKPYVLEIFAGPSVSRNLLNPEFPNSHRRLTPFIDEL